MTSLQQQLGQIAAKADPRLSRSLAQATPSYLFTSRVASQQSIDDVHAHAHNSFLDLCSSSDPRLTAYEQYFFGHHVKHLDRALCTQDENDEIDTNIRSLLSLLSPVLLLESTAWVIEWLVRKYRIHELNVNDIMAAFLPFHETPQFMHLIRIINTNSHPKFQFLAKAKDLSQPIPRDVILKQMTSSADFLDFCASILAAPLPFIQPPHQHVSFWTVYVLAFISRSSYLNEAQTNSLVRHSVDILQKTTDEESQVAVYLVISKLASVASQMHLYVEPLILAVLKNARLASEKDFTRSPRLPMGLAIGLLLKVQNKNGQLSKQSIELLFNLPNISSFLLELAQARPVTDQLIETAIAYLCKTASLEYHKSILSDLISDSTFLRQFGVKLCHELLVAESERSIRLELLNMIYKQNMGLISRIVVDEKLSDESRELIASLTDDDETKIDLNYPVEREVFRKILSRAKALVTPEEPIKNETLKQILKFLEYAGDIQTSQDADRIFMDIYFHFILPTNVSSKTTRTAWKSFEKCGLQHHSILAANLSSTWTENSETAVVAKQIVARLSNNILQSDRKVAQPIYLQCVTQQFSTGGSLASKITAGFVLLDLFGKQPALCKSEITKTIIASKYTLRKSFGNYEKAEAKLLEEVHVNGFSESVASQIYELLLFRIFKCLSAPDYDLKRPLSFDSWPDATSRYCMIQIFCKMHEQTSKATASVKRFYSWFTNKEKRISFLSFLSARAGSALEGDSSISVSTLALRELRALILAGDETGFSDFPLIPASFLALSLGTSNERSAALDLIQTISECFSNGGIKMTPWLENSSSSGSSTPKASTVQKYLDNLLAHRVELSRDGTLLTQKLKEATDSLSKRSVGAIFAHYATLWPSLNARLNLLNFVLPILDGNAFKVLIALVKSAIHGSDLQGLSSAHSSQYCQKVFEIFIRFPRSVGLSDMSSALELLFDAVKRNFYSDTSIRIAALSVIQNKFFEFVHDPIKLEIINSLLRMIKETNDTDIRNDYERCLSALKIPLSAILQLFSDFRSNITTELSSQNTNHVNQTVQSIGILFEQANFSHVLSSQQFVRAVFDTLGTLVSARNVAGSKGDVSMNQVLFTLRKISLQLDMSNSDSKNAVNISPLLDLLRASNNPQILDEALDLVGSFGRLAQEQVVQNVLPIFTFMGSSSMTRDDASSARLVKNTIRSVISILVDESEVSIEFLRKLLGTFSHVPHHRRTWVHTCLVTTLGSTQYLGTIAILIILSEVTHPITNRNNTAFSLALDLVERFDVLSQVSAGLNITEKIQEIISAENSNVSYPVISLAAFLQQAIGSKKLVTRVRALDSSKKSAAFDSIKKIIVNIAKIEIELSEEARNSDLPEYFLSLTEQLTRMLSSAAFNEVIETILESCSLITLVHALKLHKVAVSRQLPETKKSGLKLIERVVKRRTELEKVDDKRECLDFLERSVRLGTEAERMAVIGKFTDILPWLLDGETFIFGLQVIEALAIKSGTNFFSLGGPTVTALFNLIKEDKTMRNVTLPCFMTIESIFRSAPLLLDLHLEKALELYFECMVEDQTVSKETKEPDEIESPDSESGQSESDEISEDSDSEDDSEDEMSDMEDEDELTMIMEKIAPISPTAMLTSLCDLKKFENSWAPFVVDMLERAISISKTPQISSMKFSILGVFFRLQKFTDIKERLNNMFVEAASKLYEKDFKPMFTKICDWVGEDQNESGKRFIVLVDLVRYLIDRFQSIIVSYSDYVLGLMDDKDFIDMASQSPEETWIALVKLFTDALDCGADNGFWTSRRFSTLCTKMNSLLEKNVSVTPESLVSTGGLYRHIFVSCKDGNLLQRTYRNLLQFVRLEREEGEKDKRATIRSLGLSALDGIWGGAESSGSAKKALQPMVIETKSILLEIMEFGSEDDIVIVRRILNQALLRDDE